ncbi:MAG: hypothetical protein ACI4V5_00095, partial [Prevotella sp.]
MVIESPSSSAPQAYSIETGNGTTVIDQLNVITNEKTEYYDINGRKTKGLQKGLNILKQGSKTMKIIIR